MEIKLCIFKVLWTHFHGVILVSLIYNHGINILIFNNLSLFSYLIINICILVCISFIVLVFSCSCVFLLALIVLYFRFNSFSSGFSNLISVSNLVLQLKLRENEISCKRLKKCVLFYFSSLLMFSI